MPLSLHSATYDKLSLNGKEKMANQNHVNIYETYPFSIYFVLSQKDLSFIINSTFQHFLNENLRRFSKKIISLCAESFGIVYSIKERQEFSNKTGL